MIIMLNSLKKIVHFIVFENLSTEFKNESLFENEFNKLLEELVNREL